MRCPTIAIVVERFRDEIGDWRCACSRRSVRRFTPRGRWRCRPGSVEEWGSEIDLMWSDDGIVMRLPEALDRLPLDELLFDPDEIDDIVISRLPDSAMFAARFRECSARRCCCRVVGPISARRCGRTVSGLRSC